MDSALADYYLGNVYHVDKKITTLGLFIDFAKAFDCVHHSILLQKLQRYGIRGKAYEWVASYLNNRTQKVIVNDTSSEATSIDIGVPQGSILGPTLFIIYVNDLPSYLRKKCNVMQMSYADDTNFVLTGADAEEKVKIIYSNLCERVDTNKLCINEDKTSLITFFNGKSNFNDDVLLNNQNMKLSQTVKLLGLTLDSQMTWTYYLENLCKRLATVCYALRNLVRQCNLNPVMIFCFGCFQSILQYGIVHWGLSSKAQRVFVIQKWAISVISGLKRRESYRKAFKELKILTLPSLYFVHL